MIIISTLYPDLNLTVFPASVDQFTTWLNILSTDGPLIAQYQEAMDAGNQIRANEILQQIPSASQKIIRATDLNQLSQAIQAVERFYATDIEPYISEQQTNWLNVINRFSYKGVWSSGTSYLQNNIVAYTSSGLQLLFLATSNPPLGTPPSDTNYWRVLTIRGSDGLSGEGLSYRQQWSASTTYTEGDAVTYSGGLWMALQQNTNVVPGSNDEFWQLIIPIISTTYPIQSTQPSAQTQGDLWFNTQDNPTHYTYLEPLMNPATANHILYGYQAYDDLGNLITGTIVTPISITITTNPNKMTYLVGEPFDPTGMVVTVTYSNGVQNIVSDYFYNPDGNLTDQDTTITISYTEVITVTTELTINIYDISSTLNSNSWDAISYISSRSLGNNYWAVGDRKGVALNGTAGSLALNGTYYCYILGFNHNSSVEGNNRIHFQFGFNAASAGVHIAFIDGSYFVRETSGSHFNMNNNNSNTGGWASSGMRNTIIPTFRNCMPSDLKYALKSVTKYTDNTGGAKNTASYVTATTDSIFLLSEFEVFGYRTHANSAEQNYQTRYSYYSSGNSVIMYRHSLITSTAIWWLRSVDSGDIGRFCTVNASGISVDSEAAISYGFAPAFCV